MNTSKESKFDEKNILQKYEDIKKNDQQDSRQYRGLILRNQLKVMLVSDPLTKKTKKAAACMRVNVGSTSDPEEIQGLAHLLEHMLFLGNQKYPYINEFEDFIYKYSGRVDATTTPLETLYHFDVHSKRLEGALDRFVQFFLSPLLDPSTLEKEIRIVNFEHEKSLMYDDNERLILIDQETCDQTDPNHKFKCGNIKSLNDNPKLKGIDVRQELLNFFNKYYSSNQMTLCVLGRESLDELCDMICNKIPFIEIKNRNTKSFNFGFFRFALATIFFDISGIRLYGAFKAKHLKKEIKIASNDREDLIIDFKLPTSYGLITDEFDLRFFKYLEKLINCSNRNGFDYLLKLKGWIIESFPKESKIFIRLTEQGFERIDEIIGYVFQYLKLLQLEGAQKYIFDEINDKNWMESRLESNIELSLLIDNPFNCVTRIANNMISNKISDAAYICYTGKFFHMSFEPDKLNKFLNYLNTDNLRILIRSKRFIGKTNRTTKYCLTDYSYEDISEKRINKWKNVSQHLLFRLPEPKEEWMNENSFKLVETDLESSKSDKPILIRQNEFANIWYMQDVQFNSFKSFYGISIKNPILCRDSIAYACMFIYTLIIFDSIQLDNQAPCLDFELNIEFVDYGLNITINGFNEKLKLIIEQIIDLLIQPSNKFNSDHFEWAKRRFQASFKDNERLTLRGLADTKFKTFYLDEPFELEKEIQLHSDELTFEKMIEIRNKFFLSVKFLIFGFGNITRDDLKYVDAMVISRLSKSYEILPIIDPCLPRFKMPILEDNSFYILQESTPIHRLNYIFNYYQFGFINSIDDLVKLHLLRDLLDYKLFHHLRRNKILNYFIFLVVIKIGDTIGLAIELQSSFEIDYLDDCIEEFLIYSDVHLKILGDDRLKFSKKKLKSMYRTMYQFKYLEIKFYKFWILLNEINEKEKADLNLKNRSKVFLESLERITKQDIIDLFDEKLMKNKKKLSIRMIGKRKKAPIYSTNYKSFEHEKSELRQTLNNYHSVLQEGKLIDNLIEFRKSHSSYPSGCSFF